MDPSYAKASVLKLVCSDGGGCASLPYPEEGVPLEWFDLPGYEVGFVGMERSALSVSLEVEVIVRSAVGDNDKTRS
ncbi:hypothetical protein Bca4012_018542 [Brassica carinata]